MDRTGLLMQTRFAARFTGACLLAALAGIFFLGMARQAAAQSYPRDDAYRPPAAEDQYRRPLDNSIRPLPRDDGYRASAPRDDAYRPPARDYGPPPQPYNSGQPYPPPQRYGEPYPGTQEPPPVRYGEPYAPPPPPRDYDDRGPRGYDDRVRPYDEGPPEKGTFSSREILDAGHGFFGSISKGLANVVEYAFKSKGRPNGYILGQDAGGALVAGLRYGEGVLYTKDAGTHRVYWQGPSIGWDAGAEGSKVMVLVYNLRSPEQIYQRFPGVAGLAYLVGGVGITFQESDDVVVAPIRAGVGLRLGANIGYLKYTRTPTWNPF
jgi:hypothetical protein